MFLDKTNSGNQDGCCDEIFTFVDFKQIKVIYEYDLIQIELT